MKIGMEFQGGAELAAKLNALADKPKRQATIKGLRAGAEPMRDRAASLAPRSDREGLHLADHILVGTRPQTEDSTIDEETSVGIGVPRRFFYDAFLEFGTGRRAAHPFWRPAFEAEAPNTIATCAREYWKVLA